MKRIMAGYVICLVIAGLLALGAKMFYSVDLAVWAIGVALWSTVLLVLWTMGWFVYELVRVAAGRK